MISILEELARTDLLRNVSQAVLERVAAHASPLALTPGQVLLAPEENNEHVFLLLSGALTIHFDAADTAAIRELVPGVSVGEMSIIDGTRPSAYVVVKTPSRVFPIHRDLINDLVSNSKSVAGNLLRLLTVWLKEDTQRIIQDRLQIEELTDHANVDGLTGLYNRRWLDKTLERLLAHTITGKQHLCVMLIDIDHFKKYNDTQGHAGGDHALVAISHVLKTNIRTYDFATRYGGEEFMVLLPNMDLSGGVDAAERIRHATESRTITTPNGARLPGITVSIGVTVNDQDFNARSLLAAADAKLYQAKAEGRNCVRF